MFGNNMFGHHLHMAGHANPGFGSTGFGQQQQLNAFGSSKKGHTGGFGQTNPFLDPNGMMHHGYDGMHHHGHHGILRQNSLLGEMTQSKAERAKGVRPWAFSSISYPGDHGDNILSSMYQKPLEQPKPKPMLSRQQSFSMADSVARKRAPTFSSDPGKMRSMTVSASSMPGRPKVTRSLSIAEDLTEPVNMDIARPFIRRQQSLDIEKARRQSLDLGKSRRKSLWKKPLVPLQLLSRHRRSSKVKENSEQSDKSETSSLHAPSSRSRSNTLGSHKSSKSSTGSQKKSESSPENEPSKSSSSKTPSATEDEKLILSLLNPEVPDDNVFEPQKSPADERRQSVNSDTIQIESPTIVSKRVQHLKTPEQDNESVKSNKSGQLTPQETRSRTNSKSSKKSRSPTTSPVLLAQGPILANVSKPIDPIDLKPVMYTDPTDSDNSDVYYDCNNSQKNSPSANRNNNPQAVKTKKRSVKKPRNTCSSSTCTDGEDTTSTCETPPRSAFRDIQQKYHPENELETEKYPCANDSIPIDIHEAATLKVRDRGSHPNHNHSKQRPGLKRFANNDPFSRKMNDTHDEDDHKIPNPELLVIPSFAPVLRGEPGSKENLNNETADSSESGYATSYIPTSPKNYDHIKVSQFVNSLPSYPDMDEQRSESSHNDGVLNGSETESDLDEDVKVIYPPADLDLTNINCASGSDSENESIKTDASMSKLEVMKLLESPTDVKERVTNALKEKPNKPHTHFEDTQPKLSSKVRKGSNASETELLKFVPSKSDKDDVTDNASEKSIKEKHVEVNSVVVTKDSPKSEGAETRLLNEPEKPSLVASVIERFSFRREYSSVYQSKSTNCIDALLHFLNLLLFLSSAGVIGLGIWLQLKDFNVNDITIILGNNLLQVITYVAIAGAGVALLAAMCLCCGIRQDKSGLGFYAFVLVAVVIAFATAAVLSTIFSDKLKGIEFKFNFQDRLVTMYGVEGSVKNKFLTSAWNNMQSEFECCGGEGDGNGTDSWALYRKSAWFLQHADKGKIFVPESCCKKNSNIQICQGGDHDLLGPPRYAPPKKLKKYYRELNPNLNPNGCYASFSSHLSTLSMYIAMVTGGLAGLYFLTVMLTWVFCFKKSQDYNESFMDDSYYDIEDNDEVFNSIDSNLVNKDRDTNHITEETKFINTPVKSSNKTPDIILNGNVKLREIPGDDRIYESKSSNNSYYDRSYENSDTSSESDDETESGRSTPKEVIDRRNMWLSSASTAGHLLSIAIEEEDSNFEDSDDDHQNFSANV